MPAKRKTKKKKRYAHVGLGNRSRMFTNAILGDYKDVAELVGLCDMNQTRMDLWNKTFQQDFGAGPFPTYKAEEFDRMIAETKPDTVIVTTIDRAHHKYICRAMELGCDAITEKPMTIDEEKCQRIIDTQARTGRDVRVSFNYRYAPRNTEVKRIVQRGDIGQVVSVHFEWLLDTKHGADYFRRWHRDKRNSGGLLVHKATHHFDLCNWWIDSFATEVYCRGRLAFYGRANAEERGITEFYDRCYGSKLAKKDPFAINIGGRELYLEAEKEDGYIRDRSVFSDGISIEDTMAIVAQYENKAILTYSLNAFCPWEGYRVMFNGTKGRLELHVVERSYVAGTQIDQNDPSWAEKGEKLVPKKEQAITIQPHWGEREEIPIPEGKGGHGGGDPRLLNDLFLGAKDDPLKTAANFVDGAKSILLGVAGNRSMALERPVHLRDLVRFPER